jgi:hypothetical protein
MLIQGTGRGTGHETAFPELETADLRRRADGPCQSVLPNPSAPAPKDQDRREQASSPRRPIQTAQAPEEDKAMIHALFLAFLLLFFIGAARLISWLRRFVIAAS